MKYTFLTIKIKRNGDDAGNWDLPIIAHQDFYTRKPSLDAHADVLIGQGRVEGYNSITELFMPVCDLLSFNPFKVNKFFINQGGYDTEMIPAVINDFMGEYEIVDFNQNNFYGGFASANSIGSTLFRSGYSRAWASCGQTKYGGGTTYTVYSYNTIDMQSFITSDDGIRYEFEVWPEAGISSGNIDTSAFDRTNEDTQIISCHVKVNIWKNANTGKYNFSIYLGSGTYDVSYTQTADGLLDGAPLGHIYDPANPYDNKQADGDEGGNGDYDNENDPVNVPDLPSLDITSLGGLHLFKVTPTDMAALFSYMTSNAPGDAILKWFSNPIQAISACYMLPYPVLATGSAEITVLGISTGVTGYTAAQWAEWNLGSVYIGQGFGDCFLDYSPYTRVSMYLPFIGVRQLTADDVIGHNVGVIYQFDNISGACVAYITIDTAVRYSYVGSCAIGIPISQSNWGQTYIAAATSAAGAIAGGFSAAAGAIANGASGGAIIGQAAMGAVQGGGGLDAFNAKPNISRSGSMSGAGSAIGVNKPFMIIERPDKAKIEDPKNVIGITSGKTLSLGALHGFNALESFHLDHIAATGEELTEIETLLHQGVIF